MDGIRHFDFTKIERLSFNMAEKYQLLEPFPHFVDSKRPPMPRMLSSQITHTLNLLNHKPSSSLSSKVRAHLTLFEGVANYFHLKYYQYEVTFGLYMLTLREKCVLNSIIICIFAALLCAVCFGLQPVLIRSLCRLAWYINGSHEGIEDICTESVMSGGCR